MLRTIPLSFNPNGNYESIPVDDSSGSGWLTSARQEANTQAESGEIKAFEAIAFKSEHLSALLTSTYPSIGLYHIQALFEKTQKKSMLVAVSVDSDDLENPDPTKAYIGIPVSINFGSATISPGKIDFVSGFEEPKWMTGEFNPLPVGNWLSASRQQDRIRRSVDMMVRVRFKANEITALLKAHEFAAFCLVIFKCEALEKIDSKCCFTHKWYSTLMMVGLKKTADPVKFDYAEDGSRFMVSSDAWRPNYPKIDSPGILKRILTVFTKSIIKIGNRFLKILKKL